MGVLSNLPFLTFPKAGSSNMGPCLRQSSPEREQRLSTPLPSFNDCILHFRISLWFFV